MVGDEKLCGGHEIQRSADHLVNRLFDEIFQKKEGGEVLDDRGGVEFVLEKNGGLVGDRKFREELGKMLGLRSKEEMDVLGS